MRWFVRGDIDGFFGLALDNLVQLLLIVALCQGVLGFPLELIYGTIFPASAISLLIGNLFYAWQAKRLAARTGRTDVCALPYGINTVSLIAFVFLVMLPVKLQAVSNGMEEDKAAYFAFQVGLLACVGSGLIELFGSFFAQIIRRITPRAALLATLSGIALTFVSMPFVFQAYARPVVGLVTLGIILLTYFGKVRFKGGLPGGLVAILVGTAIAWGMGYSPDRSAQIQEPSWNPPQFQSDFFSLLGDWSLWQMFLPIIIPMGLFNLLGSLQNIESAEAAGDSYPTTPSLAVNGLGTLTAACFGSCFPTTIYVGHPGWKGLGARAGYSILNALFFVVICLAGLFGTIQYVIPVDAGLAIVIYIGIVITAQAFQATPSRHAPAVVLGLFPSLAGFTTLMVSQSLMVGGFGPQQPITEETIGKFHAGGTWIEGAFALDQGFVLTSMVLAALTVAIIDRQFWLGTLWALAGSAFSAIGLIHSYYVDGNTTRLAMGTPAWEWALGYAVMAALLALVPWITEPEPAESKEAAELEEDAASQPIQ